MKKKYVILSLMLMVFLTGCGKKEYICSKNIINSKDKKLDEEILVTINNKKVTKETITFKYQTKNIDGNKKALEAQYNKYQGENGIYYSFVDTENGFDFVIDLDMKKVNKDIINELELYNGKDKEVINNIQGNGYICEKK